MRRSERLEIVKFLVAVLWREDSALAESLARMRELWGTIDFEGEERPFDLTDYYETEMGRGLRRRLYSFEELIEADRIVERKLQAMAVEADLRDAEGRRVNLDVGYMDVHKVVLASVKPGALKIYLGRSVWADPTCRYSKGRFRALDWSFADFRDNRYSDDLIAIRERYKEGLRQVASP